MILFKHETSTLARLWFLTRTIFSSLYHFIVLWCTGLQNKNSASCKFPVLLVDICDLSDDYPANTVITSQKWV